MHSNGSQANSSSSSGSTVARDTANALLRYRLPFILLAHLLMTATGFLLAMGLRFDFDWSHVMTPFRLFLPLCILMLARHLTHMYYGLNHGYWRYVSGFEMSKLIKAHALGTMILITMVACLQIPSFPRSVYVIEFTLAVLISGGMRFLVRAMSERLLEMRSSHKRQNVIVLGAGDSGHLVVNNLRRYAQIAYRPVAVLDDSSHKQGTRVYGVPVAGKTYDLEKYLSQNRNIQAAIIAIPSLSKQRLKEITDICKRFEVQQKHIQTFEDISLINLPSEQAARTSIESLLEKASEIEHANEIRHELCGKRILVTGAGGSIGSELVRQIMDYDPAEIILLDHSEYNMYRIVQQIAEINPACNYRPVLANICDKTRLTQIFASYEPQIVFHAAAYKHVPLMEQNIYEAFRNNIVGTQNVIEAGHHSGAARLVLISSDKAVDPTSIMGCSKRIAELLVQEYAADSRNAGYRMSTAIVRFGNVINSSGSVIPLFKKQILSGGPLTVTHPEMRRYFMSLREAVGLVLTAGILGDTGKVYMLDMGEEILIQEVAQKMLELYDRREIPIIYTGIRPGEKLQEKLVAEHEQTDATHFSKVNVVTGSQACEPGVHDWVKQTNGQLTELSDGILARLISEVATSGANPDDLMHKGRLLHEIEVARLNNTDARMSTELLRKKLFPTGPQRPLLK